MIAGYVLEPEGLPDHIDQLYRAACALCGSRQDAEDLVQETFANVMKRPLELFVARDGLDLDLAGPLIPLHHQDADAGRCFRRARRANVDGRHGRACLRLYPLRRGRLARSASTRCPGTRR